VWGGKEWLAFIFSNMHMYSSNVSDTGNKRFVVMKNAPCNLTGFEPGGFFWHTFYCFYLETLLDRYIYFAFPYSATMN
jgi:hypothetical protein